MKYITIKEALEKAERERVLNFLIQELYNLIELTNNEDLEIFVKVNNNKIENFTLDKFPNFKKTTAKTVLIKLLQEQKPNLTILSIVLNANRTIKKMSLEDVAKKTNKTRAGVHLLETKEFNYRKKTIQDLAEALEINPLEFNELYWAI